MAARAAIGHAVGMPAPDPASLDLPTATLYRAFAERDRSFEGQFVAAIRTTGIFCRPGCPARTPNPENVAFFATPRAALAAGYRPCKRCTPLAPAGAPPTWLAPLLAAVEADPTRRWRDRDVTALGLDPKRVRRWFRAHHDMTFHAYQRARRLGAALGTLQSGAPVSDVALESGFESESGFREAFAKLAGEPPTKARRTVVELARLTTPLGPMLAGVRRGIPDEERPTGEQRVPRDLRQAAPAPRSSTANKNHAERPLALTTPPSEDALVLLEFTDRRGLETQLETLARRTGAALVPRSSASPVWRALEEQLGAYFAGTLRSFALPLDAPGTPFQTAVWAALLALPYGTTTSYGALAEAAGRPGASRAVGTANGANRIAIVIPCHRVVLASGGLSGYAGGVARKRALLHTESGTLRTE